VRRPGSLVLWSAALASVACEGTKVLPASPQLVIYVDTDAVVSKETLTPTSFLDAPALFDTIEIDGIHGGAVCATCSRQFHVFEEMFQAKEVSFGVVAPLVAGDALRVKLYLSEDAIGGPPPAEATIDVTVTLPSLPAEGVLAETLVLLTDDVGIAKRGQLTEGVPATSRVGTWAPARRVDCGAPAREGEVCVPGGAYWMGNPLVAHLGTQDGDHLRLVALSPFYVDSTEVTVAEYRPLVDAIGLGESWSGEVGCYAEDYCTFTNEPGPYDDHPMNCVTPANAAAFCQMKGKELPSEAEFEYLASGLASDSFVWGEDPPACGDAVLSRGGLGFFAGYDDACLDVSGTVHSCGGAPPGGLPLGGPLKTGSGARDRLTIALPSSTGTIYDLVGNVSEATRDDWSLLSGPCWSAPGVYTDPVCTVSSGSVSIRGGDWTGNGADARAAVRSQVLPSQFSAQLGFRCVRRVK
jgi:sulfatase modifying factor 1